MWYSYFWAWLGSLEIITLSFILVIAKDKVEFIPGWTVFCSVFLPHCIHSLTGRWTLRLLGGMSYSDQSDHVAKGCLCPCWTCSVIHQEWDEVLKYNYGFLYFFFHPSQIGFPHNLNLFLLFSFTYLKYVSSWYTEPQITMPLS